MLPSIIELKVRGSFIISYAATTLEGGCSYCCLIKLRIQYLNVKDMYCTEPVPCTCMYVHEQFEQGTIEMAGCVSVTTLLGIVNVVNVFP